MSPKNFCTNCVDAYNAPQRKKSMSKIDVMRFCSSEAVLKLIRDATDVRRFVMLSVAEASFPPELVRDELLRSHARFTRLHTPLLRLRCAEFILSEAERLRMTGQ